MSFFQFFFNLIPKVFSNVTGWAERLFNGVGLSFVVTVIFIIGINCIIKIFAPVVGQNIGEAGVAYAQLSYSRVKERYRVYRDKRNTQKRLNK